jgi:hypothetical protein
MQTAMLAYALTDFDLDYVSGGNPDGGASPDGGAPPPPPPKKDEKNNTLTIEVKGTGGAGKKPGVEGSIKFEHKF